MTTKAKIKIIKKGAKTAAPEAVKIEKKTTKETAREMVGTVSSWVSDFQHRRREETKQAIEKFFSQQPQPNGV